MNIKYQQTVPAFILVHNGSIMDPKGNLVKNLSGAKIFYTEEHATRICDLWQERHNSDMKVFDVNVPTVVDTIETDEDEFTL